jgi:excisionase family DNA binding protein
LKALEDVLNDFVVTATHVTELLERHGARDVALARSALITDLEDVIAEWRSQEVSPIEAATLLGTCAETVRRRIRGGQLRATRNGARGRYKLRPSDLTTYNLKQDAQDIAKLRRG